VWGGGQVASRSWSSMLLRLRLAPCDPRSLSHPSGVDGARFAPVLLRTWFVSCLPPRCWPLWWLWAACWLLGGGLVVGGAGRCSGGCVGSRRWGGGGGWVLWGLCGVEGLGWWWVFLAAWGAGGGGVRCGVLVVPVVPVVPVLPVVLVVRVVCSHFRVFMR